jgi:hypothetical protein
LASLVSIVLTLASFSDSAYSKISMRRSARSLSITTSREAESRTSRSAPNSPTRQGRSPWMEPSDFALSTGSRSTVADSSSSMACSNPQTFSSATSTAAS